MRISDWSSDVCSSDLRVRVDVCVRMNVRNSVSKCVYSHESNLYRGGTGGRKAVPAPAALAKRTVDAHARTGGNLTDHDPTRRNLDLRPESCCESVIFTTGEDPVQRIDVERLGRRS